MNKTILIIAIFPISLAFADTIYLKKGEKIENAIVAEVNEGEVKYKVGERQTVYTIKKSDISSISYNDGTEDVFEAKMKIEEVEKEDITKLPEKNPEKPKPAEVGVAFGARVSYGTALGPDYPEKFNPVYEIGVFMSIPIKNTATFNPGLSLFYRNYSVDLATPNWWYGSIGGKKNYEIEEWAISIPVLFQVMPFDGSPFYMEGGFQLGFASSDDAGELPNDPLGTRFEGKAVLGFGWNINEHLAIGIRSSINPFGETYESFLEAGLGLNYLF